MKQRIFSICLAAMFALGAQAQGTFTLIGNIKNAEGQKVRLYYGTQNEPKSDSTVVKNGKFILKGNLPGAYSQANILLGNYDPYSTNNKLLQCYLEPNVTTKVDGDANDITKMVVKGGPVQDDANELMALQSPGIMPLRQLNKDYVSAKTDAEREAIKKKMTPYSDFSSAATRFFIATHPDSYVAAQQMPFLMGDMKYEEIKEIYDAWTPKVKACEPAQEVKAELDVLSKVRPGCPAPDFTANDINGKPFTLSSLKGKVVIIDFWASWCKPCRQSNPHMRELYGKFHDKGFDIVYVSDDDSHPDKWKKAVNEDGLIGEGYHHVLRGLKVDRTKKGMDMFDKTNDISDKYAIHYLPTKYLIDKQGNIVCKVDESNEGKLEGLISDLLK
jgi:peroxiredoxin